MSKGNPVNDVKALIKEWSFRPDLFVEEAL